MPPAFSTTSIGPSSLQLPRAGRVPRARPNVSSSKRRTAPRGNHATFNGTPMLSSPSSRTEAQREVSPLSAPRGGWHHAVTPGTFHSRRPKRPPGKAGGTLPGKNLGGQG